MLNRALLLLSFCTAAFVQAQQTLTPDQAVDLALRNNGWAQSADLRLKEAGQLRKTATEVSPFSFMWMKGQYNSLRQDNNLTFTQTLPLPSVMAAKARLGQEQERGAQYQLAVVRQEIRFQVKEAADQFLYLKAYRDLLLSQDSLFRESASAAAARYRTGEGTMLEQLTAEAKAMEAGNRLRQGESDILIHEARLSALLRTDLPVSISGTFVRIGESSIPDTASVRSSARHLDAQQQAIISRQQVRLEKQVLLPQITLGYFNQSLIGYQNINEVETFYGADKRFTGFQAGLSLPLWARPQISRARAASLQADARQAEAGQIRHELRRELEEASQEHIKATRGLEYYEQSANRNAILIIRQARTAFRRGELSYITYLQSLQSALEIQTGYLQMLRLYNQSLLKIQYLTGQFAD